MEQTTISGEDIRDVFEATLPDKQLCEFIEKANFQQRQRKLDALRLVRAMIIAAATGYGGRQADIMRAYFEMGCERVVRGGFYSWFNPELEHVMKMVSDHALAYAAELDVDLPGFLGEHVLDWHIVDSTTVKLPDELKSTYPGSGDYAALKIHKRLSVGIGATVQYHLSPAKEHDARHLKIDETWRHLGLLADLGYASFELIRDCYTYEVKFVIRLKENWKPRVQSISRGDVTKTFFKGSDLNGLIEAGVIQLNGKVVDMEVAFGSGKKEFFCRLVGIPTPQGSYRFYLTNLPACVGPNQISDLYRIRWEIETDNKLDKSCFHLSEITSTTAHAVRALVHASMVSSLIASLIAHRYRMAEIKPSSKGTERTQPPIHTQSMARAMGCAADKIANAMDLKGDEAIKAWNQILGYLLHLGKDPNWRRNPSILDQLRGWKISPGRPRKTRRSSRSPN